MSLTPEDENLAGKSRAGARDELNGLFLAQRR